MNGDSPDVSVLCIDDEPGMAELVGTYLEQADDGMTVTAETSATAALEDTGVGIDPEVRDRLFESSISSSEDGTGIRVRVVSQIVTGHGRDIEATESASGGARFEVTGVDQP